MDIEPQKIMAHPLAAGIIGSLVGLRLAPGLSWLERLTNVAAGSVCAGFAAPAAGELFKLTSPAMMSFLAFVLGLFGMSIASAVMQALRDAKLGEAITSWLTRK